MICFPLSFVFVDMALHYGFYFQKLHRIKFVNFLRFDPGSG